MTTTTPAPATLPLHARLTGSGDLAALEAGGLSVLQYPSTELESGPAGLWLRITGVGAARLTGPASGGRVDGQALVTDHGAVRARVTFALTEDASSFRWRVALENRGTEPVAVDVACTLDTALAPPGDVRRNEQYIAQYLDLTPVRGSDVPGSLALAVRQNAPGPRAPWAALWADAPVAQWATDALQVRAHDGEEGIDLDGDLPSRRLQHEHTLAAVRTAGRTLAPRERWDVGFGGAVLADHPAATSSTDAALIARLARSAARETSIPPGPTGAAPVSRFARARPLPVREATAAERARLAPGPHRAVETVDGAHRSSFAEDGHVVSAAKERVVLRPHGHLQHVARHIVADASSVASTVWMRGVFCSQLTAGHASAAPVTSIRRSYLGLLRGGGVRLLAAPEGDAWSLLSIPSLFRAGPVDAEWVYLLPAGRVRVLAAPDLDGSVTLRVETTGDTPPLLAVIFPDADRPKVTATADGARVALGDAGVLFADGTSHGVDAITAALGTAGSAELRLAVPGERAGGSPARWRLPSLSGGAGEGVEALAATLPWLAHDAQIHFQAPRGLEQFTGGAWGTRDVCQGPVGLLMAADEPAALRETLLRVLSAQQTGGDWPQWFDYLPGHAGPGLRDSHGDVVYWPLRALADYLELTGDATILDEAAPWVGEAAMLDATPVLDHVERALAHIAAHRTADPRLPAYGHGDWNDSLQPARPELAEHMCSTWTTELEIVALRSLATALEQTDRAPGTIARCRALADAAEQGLRERLLMDGELAGYAVLDGEQVELLVHPRDARIRHGSLQMIHAIADELLTPEEAAAHRDLLEQHLLGPTGVYLFDRPLEYHGGVMQRFVRAEAATFWGREIGLMYMHAHLRFLEALARLGETEALWEQLLHAIPAGLTDRVGGAAVRQANTYFSSSDAAFADREEATARARDLFDPATVFEGGWRVYSSGPGLLLRLIVEDVLGVRRRAHGVEIDPVLPRALDGVQAEIPFDGGWITVRFERGKRGCGLERVEVDGVEVGGEPVHRRYRRAGLVLTPGTLRAGASLVVRTA